MVESQPNPSRWRFRYVYTGECGWEAGMEFCANLWQVEFIAENGEKQSLRKELLGRFFCPPLLSAPTQFRLCV